MKVAVLGTGAAALALGVMLRRGGHDPVLWSPSGRGILPLRDQPISATGVLTENHQVETAETVETALRGAGAVIVAVPAMAHRAVFDVIAGHLCADQIVIISAHLSLGALYLQRLLAQRGIELPVIGWSTTLLRARKTDGHTVRIATIRKKVDIGVVPAAFSNEGLAVCQDLFGDHFNLRSDILAVSLSNVNPQSHMALALLNFTRMELAEEWNQAECSTAAVQKLNGALDGERMRIASELGLEVRSLQEHREQTHGKEAGAKIVTFGPATTETRYTLEDVPFGLVPTLRIARVAGVEVPIHQAGIAFFSALYGRDFEAENDLISAIAVEAMPPGEFVRVCKEGFPVSQTPESRHSLHGG